MSQGNVGMCYLTHPVRIRKNTTLQKIIKKQIEHIATKQYCCVGGIGE